jgi:hypothetical protein
MNSSILSLLGVQDRRVESGAALQPALCMPERGLKHRATRDIRRRFKIREPIRRAPPASETPVDASSVFHSYLSELFIPIVVGYKAECTMRLPPIP